MVGAEVDKASLLKLKKQLDKLSMKKQEKALMSILSTSSLPIRKAAKAKAKQEIKPNKGFDFNVEKKEYNILPHTIEKSIGVIKLKKARVPAIDVGYRTKGRYNGWFAHFVDSGTANRKIKYGKRRGANTGSIEPHNIMEAGKTGIPLSEKKIKKDILRMIKRLAK